MPGTVRVSVEFDGVSVLPDPSFVDTPYNVPAGSSYVSLYASSVVSVEYSAMQILGALNLLVELPGGTPASVSDALQAAGISGTPVAVRRERERERCQ